MPKNKGVQRATASITHAPRYKPGQACQWVSYLNDRIIEISRELVRTSTEAAKTSAIRTTRLKADVGHPRLVSR